MTSRPNPGPAQAEPAPHAAPSINDSIDDSIDEATDASTDEAVAAFCREALLDSLQRSNQVARELHRRIAGPGESPTTAEVVVLAHAFDRASLAIRKTVLLLQKPARPAAAAPNHAAIRKHVLRTVEDRIAERAESPERVEALEAELHERIDSGGLAFDIATRPPAEIVADLLSDLGLIRIGAKRRTPEAAATLHERAAGRPNLRPNPH